MSCDNITIQVVTPPPISIEVEPIVNTVIEVGPVGARGPVGPQGPQGPPGSPQIPEYSSDPIAPQPEDAWVLKTTVYPPIVLSHTLLQIGLTAPGQLVNFQYAFKYRTQNGTTVSVALT